jgi:hypothetical protein
MGTPDDGRAPYYRISEYYFASIDDLQEAFTNEAGGHLSENLANLFAGTGFSSSVTTRYERIRSYACHAHPGVFRRASLRRISCKGSTSRVYLRVHQARECRNNGAACQRKAHADDYESSARHQECGEA